MTLATNIATLVTSPVSALTSIKSAQQLTDVSIIIKLLSPRIIAIPTNPVSSITATGINTNNIVKPKSTLQPLTDNTITTKTITIPRIILNTKPLLTITSTGINTNNIVKPKSTLQPLTVNTITTKTITIPRLTLNPNISLGSTINQTVSVMNGTVTIKQSLIAYWS